MNKNFVNHVLLNKKEMGQVLTDGFGRKYVLTPVYDKDDAFSKYNFPSGYNVNLVRQDGSCESLIGYHCFVPETEEREWASEYWSIRRLYQADRKFSEVNSSIAEELLGIAVDHPLSCISNMDKFVRVFWQGRLNMLPYKMSRIEKDCADDMARLLGADYCTDLTVGKKNIICVGGIGYYYADVVEPKNQSYYRILDCDNLLQHSFNSI